MTGQISSQDNKSAILLQSILLIASVFQPSSKNNVGFLGNHLAPFLMILCYYLNTGTYRGCW